jgi:putative two-component system response regulator
MGYVPGKVLVADDDVRICELVSNALSAEGIICVTTSVWTEACTLLERDTFSAILTDDRFARRGRPDLVTHARIWNPSCRILICSRSADGSIEALAKGAHAWLAKPLDAAEACSRIRNALATGLQRESRIGPKRAEQVVTRHGQSAIDGIRALVDAIAAKDSATRRHCEQVTFYVTGMCGFLGLSEDHRESIWIASLLHDIGKIGVPDAILTKTGRLSPGEFARIQRHPQIGADILSNISMFAEESRLVRYHHERWDGLGYPHGLAAGDIPFGSRLLGVADAVDAMLSRRSYKDAYSVEATLEELDRCAGSQFDPEIARAASEWISRSPENVIRPMDQAA